MPLPNLTPPFFLKYGSNDKCSAPFHFLKKHICSKSFPEDDIDPFGQNRFPNKKQKLHIPSKPPPPSTYQSSEPFLSLPLKHSLSDSTPQSSATPSFLKESFSPQQSNPIHSSLSTSPPIIFSSNVTFLNHNSQPGPLQSPMHHCSWNPTDPLTIAIGFLSKVSIWKVALDPLLLEPQLHVNLSHDTFSDENDLPEVNSMQWAPNGALIATGASDGSTWLWSRSGVRIFHAKKHIGPVFNTEWNTRGNVIATSAVDRKIIIWDSATFSSLQQIEVFETPIISLDWHNDSTFAVSSLNPSIYIFNTSKNHPIFRFSHDADVNKVSWSSNHKTLVSCSDDSTLKFWNLNSSDPCLWTATGHKNKINTCQWCPARDVNIVASAGSDGTVRIWDFSRKECLYVLQHSYKDVSCLNFSPDGKLLATCTEDGIVNIWSTDTGQPVGIFDAKIQIFDSRWNRTGRKLALTLGNSSVAVIDFPPPSVHLS